MGHLEEIFKEDARKYYEHHPSENAIKLKKNKNTYLKNKLEDTDEKEVEEWIKVQKEFLIRAKDEKQSMFDEENVVKKKNIKEKFFDKNGYLKGNILDIGGGWGTYREWWRYNSNNIYIVHDPGIDRFLEDPHEPVKKHYSTAFEKPMTFVEGFGEVMPYKDRTFDTCLIASTIRHCAKPKYVLKEAYRCLDKGGLILIIDKFLESDEKDNSSSNLLFKLFTHFKEHGFLNTLSDIKWRLNKDFIGEDKHLHHFEIKEFKNLMNDANFTELRTYNQYGTRYVIQGRK